MEDLTTTDRVPMEKRQTAPFAVTGIQGSGVQTRLEIRTLANNPDQFNIYLLALQKMQTDDQSDFLSYFQISGMFQSSAIWKSPTNSRHQEYMGVLKLVGTGSRVYRATATLDTAPTSPTFSYPGTDPILRFMRFVYSTVAPSMFKFTDRTCSKY